MKYESKIIRYTGPQPGTGDVFPAVVETETGLAAPHMTTQVADMAAESMNEGTLGTDGYHWWPPTIWELAE